MNNVNILYTREFVKEHHGEAIKIAIELQELITKRFASSNGLVSTLLEALTIAKLAAAFIVATESDAKQEPMKRLVKKAFLETLEIELKTTNEIMKEYEEEENDTRD